jgi:hypothetical protein
MKLLEAQPEIAPGAPPEPPVERPPDEPAVDPVARTCRSCGATMEPGQDWCLACGTAAGRIGTRPGARSAMTVFGLTALLVAGAVGASYAALREDQTVPPSQSAAQVAQAPAATPPPAAPTTPPASTTTTPAPGTGTTTGKSSIPKVQVPSNTSSVPTPKAAPPVAPQTTPPASTSTPTPTPAPAPAPSTPSTPSSGSGSQTSTGSSTTPAPSAPVAIDLGASATSVYDPYRRATAVGVPAKAIDGDGSTSWYVDTAAGQSTVGVGLAVDLGEARGVKSLDITTPTPGYKVEVYASDEATPPPTITDTRWAHITDKSDVGTDGKTHIVLGAGTSKYRTLLLWITKPPSDGARVRIAELKVFG